MSANVSCPACKAIIPLAPPRDPLEQAFLVVACNAGDDDHSFRQVAESAEHALEIVGSILPRFDYVHVDNLRDLDSSYLDAREERAA